MSRWKQNFESQEAIQKVQAALSDLEQANLESITPIQRTEYERAIKVLKILEARFTSLDPELFNPDTWGNFGGWFDNVKQYAKAASQSINSGYLAHLNNMLDQVLQVLRPIDIKYSKAEVKAFTEAAAIYRQKIVDELALVKKKADEIQKQYDLLSNEVSQGQSRLDKNDNVIESQKTRLDTSIAEFQKQFSAAQEGRSLEHQKIVASIIADAEAQLKIFDASYKTAAETQKTEWDTLVAKTKKNTDDHLEFLKKRKKEVDEIFGAIGSAALAGNFNEIANKERDAANNWRNIAFCFMVAMGAVAVTAFVYTLVDKTVQWENFLFRLGTVVVIAVPAFYAANESSKHREREKTARKNFLELSSIDAYLVHLPEKERNEIKGKLSDKFFGVPEVHEKTESVSKKDLLGLLEKTIKDFTKGH